MPDAAAKGRLVALGLQTLYSLLMVVFCSYLAFDAFQKRNVPLLGVGLGTCAVVGAVVFALRLKLLVRLKAELSPQSRAESHQRRN